MTTFAVLADVHANLEALVRAVVASYASRDPQLERDADRIVSVLRGEADRYAAVVREGYEGKWRHQAAE